MDTLITIGGDGKITYKSGLEYSRDGTVKVKKWLKGTVYPFPESGCKCFEFPCICGINPETELTKDFSLQFPVVLYMDKYGNYLVLKHDFTELDLGSSGSNHMLQVYKPVEGQEYLQMATEEFENQAIYKAIYFSVTQFPMEWKPSYK